MNDQDASRRLIRPPIVAAFCVMLFVATSSCVQQQRIAVVDVQRAYQHSPLGMVSAILVRDGMGRFQIELE
jgi:Skp family chaperone for outer membrane proteins